MATSYVSIRSFHAKKEQSEQIQFVGSGITLLDLKREILERKNIAGSTDFDFKIIDEFDRGIYYLFLLFLAGILWVDVCEALQMLFLMLLLYHSISRIQTR